MSYPFTAPANKGVFILAEKSILFMKKEKGETLFSELTNYGLGGSIKQRNLLSKKNNKGD